MSAYITAMPTTILFMNTFHKAIFCKYITVVVTGCPKPAKGKHARNCLFFAEPSDLSYLVLIRYLVVRVSGQYEAVTVLFCDVVAFSQIVTRCRAKDVVNLLTQLHAKFDRVCQVHETYRVSSRYNFAGVLSRSDRGVI